jgi:hypothetical protein
MWSGAMAACPLILKFFYTSDFVGGADQLAGWFSASVRRGLWCPRSRHALGAWKTMGYAWSPGVTRLAAVSAGLIVAAFASSSLLEDDCAIGRRIIACVSRMHVERERPCPKTWAPEELHNLAQKGRLVGRVNRQVGWLLLKAGAM